MANAPEQPTMQEILMAFSEGEIKRALDEIERSVAIIRKYTISDDVLNADEAELHDHVRTIGFYAEALPRQISAAFEHAKKRD